MASRTTDGYLALKEGVLYWKLTTSGEDSKDRPVLLFIHAGVANHTLWDNQVDYFCRRGWDCLRYDLFGYGNSQPSKEYLQSYPREPVNHIDHTYEILRQRARVVLIGNSMGAALSVDYLLQHPECVVGLVALAGGVSGLEELRNKPEEEILFEKVDALTQAGDVARLAALQTRIWGDGPLQHENRMPAPLRKLLLDWNLDISNRECEKTGGHAIECAEVDTASGRLDQIRVPTIVGYGIYDESSTNEAMKYLANAVAGAEIKEFKTAHMISFEAPEELNDWLDAWLRSNFDA